MVDSLRLEPLGELVDLVIVHLERARALHFALDVDDGALEPFLAYF